jgi:hypothetical protein
MTKVGQQRTPYAFVENLRYRVGRGFVVAGYILPAPARPDESGDYEQGFVQTHMLPVPPFDPYARMLLCSKHEVRSPKHEVQLDEYTAHSFFFKILVAFANDRVMMHLTCQFWPAHRS